MIKIKQSKGYTTFIWVLIVVAIFAMLIPIGFLTKEIADYYNENQSINVSSLCNLIICVVFVIAFAIGSILSAMRTMKATYTFTNEKIVKEYKQNVKLEVPYSTIITARIMGMDVEIFYKKETDKGTKSLHVYFDKTDVNKVIDKLTEYNNENNGNINIQILNLWGR